MRVLLLFVCMLDVCAEGGTWSVEEGVEIKEIFSGFGDELMRAGVRGKDLSDGRSCGL